MSDQDVRDERLGELLDQAVRDLRPHAGAPPGAGRESGERRAARTVAALVTAAVFIGVALWAAVSVGRDRPAPSAAETQVPSSADAPWTFDNEAGWHVATVASADRDATANVLETYIANVLLPEPAELGPGPNSGGSDALTESLGEGAAVVLVNRVWSPATDICSGADESGPGPFADDAQNPGWTFRERRRCDGTLGFHVIEWLGPVASDADRVIAETIADSVRVADVDRWAESDGERVTLHDESDLFTVTYPASWLVADRLINTWVSDPHEILSLATYPLRPGGHAVTDGQVPSNAIDDMGPDDVFIWVNEDTSGGGEGYPARPGSLSPETICENTRCVDGQALGIEGIRAWWTYFGDEGRGIYVFVGMGDDAYRGPTLGEAWAVVDSLRFAPTRVPASGFFSECPSLSDAAPISSSSRSGAEAAAEEFVRASNAGDADGLARLLDPAAGANNVTSLGSSAVEPVIGSAAAVGDPLVEGSCGQEVATRSWRVTIDDGTSSASLDTSLYLIERSDGWKVWGAY
jgi:hypothetical protein